MFYSLTRIISPRSSIARVATRVFGHNASFAREKHPDEQIDYLKSIIESNAEDWTVVKNDVLSKQGNVNQKNIDAIMLKYMIGFKNYKAALSFAEHVKSSSEDLSLGTINALLNLYYEIGKTDKLSKEQTKFIVDAHKSLHDKYKFLEYSTCERLLHALCVINEWEKALQVLAEIHLSTVPSHSAYSTIIATFFRLNKKKKALELIEQSLKNKRPLLENAYEAWLNYILRKYKDKKIITKHLDEVFSFLAKNCATIPLNTANKLKEVYSSMEWDAQFARIRKVDGQCSCCKETLDCLSLTDEEYTSLQQNVKEKLIVGSDLFLKTSPEELKRFSDFLEKTAPYDIVLDGLNIAYTVGLGNNMEKVKLLNSVVDHFVRQKKKILLLGRQHMLMWNKRIMQQIMDNTKFFFTDNISQDDPYFITAAILSGPQTDIVSKDLLRGHKFLLKDENLRLVFKRWQWQHQWMVFPNNQRPLQIVAVHPKIPFKPENIGKKKEEARVALFTAMHTSIRVVDHMGEVINHSHKEDDKIHLHRTKCSSIINNVWAPNFSENLKEDLKDQPYSLLLDESTDISVHKYLGIVIIYYSHTHKKITSTYLDLPMLFECNGDGIVAALKETLNKLDIPLENLMAIGTDNASVMTGMNNGVYAKLKRDLPHLILVRCLCHSLQLAVSEIAKQLMPRNLEFLIKETYDWFCRSSSRQLTYKELYKLINDGKDPLKIVQSCQTRWLSIESAVSRIYTQWLELKAYFNIAKINERCHTAEILHGMYCDGVNYAFIAFIYPILTEVNRVNKMFEDTDHAKLYDELTNLISILVSKITAPDHHNLDILTQNIEDFVDSRSYLGYRFETNLLKMKEKGLPQRDEELIRGRYIQFIVQLIKKLRNRLPANLNLMRSIKRISVDHALSHNKDSIADLMLRFNKNQEVVGNVEEQWRQIHLMSWKNTKNTKEFRYEVLNFEDISGMNRFKDLAQFAISLLILPHSNADVERLFSIMYVVKSKSRNQMKLDLLTSILTVRAGLAREGKCCHDYKIPNSVVQKIGTKEIYASAMSHAEENNDDDSSGGDFFFFLRMGYHQMTPPALGGAEGSVRLLLTVWR